jgi:replicative DNA helicase
MDKLFDETFEEVKARSTDGSVGFTTSIKALDKLIGGYQAKKLYTFAGRPGMAKTAFAMQSASHLAYYHDVPTVFFSIEMPEREIMRRMMANLTGVEYWRIEKKYWAQEHLDKIAEARDRLIQMPLHINDSGSITLSQMIAKIKGLKIKFGDLGPVFIDYLQLMKIPIPRGGNRDIAIGEVTRAFKELAKDLSIPVVILSQVKRAVEERDNKRPTLADLRESGNIEQNSDVVVFPYRDAYYTRDPLTEKDCEFIVAKNRAGRVDTAEVYVDLDYQKFSDIEGEI